VEAFVILAGKTDLGALDLDLHDLVADGTRPSVAEFDKAVDPGIDLSCRIEDETHAEELALGDGNRFLPAMIFGMNDSGLAAPRAPQGPKPLLILLGAEDRASANYSEMPGSLPILLRECASAPPALLSL
jgi:hypothetical protein